ncbi:MAG TPA: formate dehydrogenase accessory sulfurtransferase FdhD [Candidatus Acidoferrum sp.]|nr:formate dehydrogenase accessory sulfurtransferase FdhD [Candidatus Acidoferrum sp.]
MNLIAKSVNLTRVTEWNAGRATVKDDFLAAEEPLEIRIGEEPLSVTMRTPGHDRELAAGFLLTESFVSERAQIASIDAVASGPEGQRGNIIRVQLSSDVPFDPQSIRRNFFAASSCGICGKASIDSVRARALQAPNPHLRLDSSTLLRLPESLRSSQDVFERTGGLHAAALFDPAGQLLCLREDIGRHNAVDKVIGWALLDGRVPLRDAVLLVSGRGGFEIVQKAIVAGLPIVACVSAPSSLAVQLAREMRLTLVGFLRASRFVIYSGPERIVGASEE